MLSCLKQSRILETKKAPELLFVCEDICPLIEEASSVLKQLTESWVLLLNRSRVIIELKKAIAFK